MTDKREVSGCLCYKKVFWHFNRYFFLLFFHLIEGCTAYKWKIVNLLTRTKNVDGGISPCHWMKTILWLAIICICQIAIYDYVSCCIFISFRIIFYTFYGVHVLVWILSICVWYCKRSSNCHSWKKSFCILFTILSIYSNRYFIHWMLNGKSFHRIIFDAYTMHNRKNRIQCN